MVIQEKKSYLSEDVFALVEQGKITVAEAVQMLRQKTLVARTANVSDKCSRPRVEELFAELDSLIGLQNVKKLIREMYAFIEIQKRRQQHCLANEPLVLHMIFKGNPGTGKTTVARIVGQFLQASGILPKGHVIEVERADLVGEYIGHTAQKTREQIKKAMGGILFIDEAYSLARGGEKDFGKEAIDCLVKAMEDNRNEFIIILAGYPNEMNAFLQTNPGLVSRLPITMDFNDYSTDELLCIAEHMVLKKEYCLSAVACEVLKKQLERQIHSINEHGNARSIRNLLERAIRRQAVRLLDKKNITRDDLMIILPEDLREVDL